MKRICSNSLLICLCIQSVYSQDWQFKTVANGIKPTVAIDQNDVPNVAFMHEANQGFVKNAVIENDTWVISTVATGYFYGPLDIAIDQNNLPRIVYHDHNAGGGDMIHAQKLGGGGWSREQIESTNHDGWDGSIFIDQNNASHMASVDPQAGIEYAYLDENSEIVELPGSGSFTYKHSTSILVDPDGTIHIAYYQASDGELQYARKINGIWLLESVETGAQFPTLIRGEGDTIEIAFYKQITSSVGKVAIAKRLENEWRVDNVDTLIEVDLFSTARHMVDLKYKNNTYHMAYSDRKYLIYATKVGGNWKKETILDVFNENTILGQQTSLDIDSHNNPHISYYEVNNSLPEKGIIKYTTKETIPLLTVNCPPDIDLICDFETDPSFTGEPIVTNNPGISINIVYNDMTFPKNCMSEGDTILRSWTISNDIGQQTNCSQRVTNTIYDLNDLFFPKDKSFEGICFEEFLQLPPDTIANLCPVLSTSFIDSLIDPTCNSEINISREWQVLDNCGIIVRDTQMIQLMNVPSFQTINEEITSDNGDNSGAITYDIECGVPPFSFFWSNGSEDSVLVNIKGGNYSLTIIDGVQCLEVIEFDVPGLNSVPFLSGKIRDFEGKNISNVDISLSFLNDNVSFSNCSSSSTGIDYCVIDTVEIQGNIELCLSKTDNPVAGVTALDIIRARNIILGLVNPCVNNLIAGDVNLSGNISGLDLVLIQRVILGFSSEFPSGKSWIFQREGTEVECDTFSSESLPIKDLEYLGVKLGDLSCQDTIINFKDEKNDIEVRSPHATILQIANQKLNPGRVYKIAFNIDSRESLLGLQTRLKLKNELVKSLELKSGISIPGEFNHRIGNNDISVLAFDSYPLKFEEDQILAILKLEVQREVAISDLLELDDDFTNVSYNAFEQELPVQLEFLPEFSLEENNSLHISPNPFTNEIKLKIPKEFLNGDFNICIRDLSGKKIYSEFVPSASTQITDKTITIKTLQDGLYLIEVSNASKKEVRKIIKSNL